MNDDIHISELYNFKSHRSLNESPASFETKKLFGKIFYLPIGDVSGDSFIIHSNNMFTVSLVGDMTGHGLHAREKLIPYLSELDSIVKSASEYGNNEYLHNIVKLDKKINSYDEAMALTIIRLDSDNRFECFNGGENVIILRNNGNVMQLGPEFFSGKIGTISLIYSLHHKVSDSNAISNNIPTYKTQLDSGDRILICSDGVIELSGNFTEEKNARDNLIK
ncbi:MAG: SpoIIE family protein phosphatase [Candidatus Woesearchaeota archaeon]